MNMKQIEGFCYLAQTLSFSKAADRLYLSQPAFSRMIVSMEEELGCQLFVRSKSDPKLTVAGEKIYRHMLEMSKLYKIVQGIAGMADRNGIGMLSIGVLDDGMDETVIEVVRAFRKRFPDVGIEFREHSEVDIFRALDVELIDIALSAHYPEVYRESTEGVALRQDVEGVYFHEDHPLAKEKEIRLEQLKDEPFIMMNREKSEMGFGRVMSICLERGFVPNIVMEAESIASALSAVDCGLGCTVLLGRFQSLGSPSLRFVPLANGATCSSWLIWKKNATNPQIANWKKVLTEDMGKQIE